ncbi:MAG: hypothetical protein RLZZ352_2374 [Pseudomonadota bacterium]
MSADDDNFFSRWSRRKAQVRSGQPLPPDVPHAPAPASVKPPAPVAAPAAIAPPPAQATQPTQPPPPALPTLDDVARLTRDADFSPFVGRQVPADVRNAAMKKLFTDPHYNVMDGLDIYIDDYSQPSPLSAAMMAKMVGAQFLKLVEDPQAAKPAATASTDTASAAASPADAAAAPEPSPESATPAPTAPPETPHDHADLQLQPDHAPEPQSPGHGAG